MAHSLIHRGIPKAVLRQPRKFYETLTSITPQFWADLSAIPQTVWAATTSRHCLDSWIRTRINGPGAYLSVSVLLVFALSTSPGPGHRFQARPPNRLPAFLTGAKSPLPNPR
jgi:hypothetical protein